MRINNQLPYRLGFLLSFQLAPRIGLSHHQTPIRGIFEKRGALAFFLTLGAQVDAGLKRRRVSSAWAAVLLETRWGLMFNVRWLWMTYTQTFLLLTSLRARGARLMLWSSPAFAPLCLAFNWLSWPASFLAWRKQAHFYWTKQVLRGGAFPHKDAFVVKRALDVAFVISPVFHSQTLDFFEAYNIPVIGPTSLTQEPWRYYHSVPLGLHSPERAVYPLLASALV